MSSNALRICLDIGSDYPVAGIVLTLSTKDNLLPKTAVVEVIRGTSRLILSDSLIRAEGYLGRMECRKVDAPVDFIHAQPSP